jgi:hypothetical protein
LAAAETDDVVAVAEGWAAGVGSGEADVVARALARGDELAVGSGVGLVEPALGPAGDVAPAAGEQVRSAVPDGQAALADPLAASVRAGAAPPVAMCRAITAAANTTTVAASAR